MFCKRHVSSAYKFSVLIQVMDVTNMEQTVIQLLSLPAFLYF